MYSEEHVGPASLDGSPESLIAFSREAKSGQRVNLAEPYSETCGLCKEMLFEPYQTRCGHRLCKTCLDRHLQEHGDPAMCPYNEGDCEVISLKNSDGSVRITFSYHLFWRKLHLFYFFYFKNIILRL